MPVPAVGRAVAFQRVHVEIVLAIAAEPGEGAVVERRLEHFGILAVEIEVQHALRPEDQRDGGAGLGIGGLVGQVVVVGEALVVRRRAEACGDVHLGDQDVVPQRLARRLQPGIAEFDGEVGHGGVHVHGAHRVPDHLVLLAHRLVALRVLVGALGVALPLPALLFAFLALDVEIVRRLAAAFVDEVGGEIEVLLLAGQPIELDQRDLDFLVAVIAALLAGTSAEGLADMLDIALHDVEPAATAGGLEVSDGAFQHVAGIVELVVVAQVAPALFGFTPEIPAVEVTVGRLGALEIVDDGLDPGLDVGVAAVAQRIGGGLDPLADVAVPEHLHGEAVGMARKAQGRRRVGQLQRIQQPVFAELPVLAGNGAGENGVEPLLPEIAFKADVDKADRVILAHFYSLCPRSRASAGGSLFSVWWIAARPACRAGGGCRYGYCRRSCRRAAARLRDQGRKGSCRYW